MAKTEIGKLVGKIGSLKIDIEEYLEVEEETATIAEIEESLSELRKLRSELVAANLELAHLDSTHSKTKNEEVVKKVSKKMNILKLRKKKIDEESAIKANERRADESLKRGLQERMKVMIQSIKQVNRLIWVKLIYPLATLLLIPWMGMVLNYFADKVKEDKTDKTKNGSRKIGIHKAETSEDGHKDEHENEGENEHEDEYEDEHQDENENKHQEEKQDEQDKPSTNYSYVKLSGLPWKTNTNEIDDFLVDCSISNIVIIKEERGRPSGDAVVELVGETDMKSALKCNRKFLHNRFILIEETDKNTYSKHVGKLVVEDTQEDAFVKLSGLDWKSTKEDINTLLTDCNVREAVITTNESGKPSGEAFVHLETKADAKKAMAHNREYIRERYVIIELINEEQFNKETKKEKKQVEESNVVNKVKKRADSKQDPVPDNQAMEQKQSNRRKEEKNPTVKQQAESREEKKIKFIVKPKPSVGANVAKEECKEIKIDGVIWEPGKINKESEVELECTVRYDIDAKDIKRKLEELDNYVGHVEIVDNNIVLDEPTFTFEIRTFDQDEKEVLQECRNLKLLGVTWGKGQLIQISDKKSNIKLECSVKQSKTNADFIKNALEDLDTIEDVTII
eukprot:GFUD01029397.1.p1 GENE.GFUD01029397.1~~GFUD01029397.1.p1  ORF type:complete len:624 (+),score=190.11 GFUD01029397.1:161-2032(+)